MPPPETNRQKVVARLRQEGWLEEHGGEHDTFVRATALRAT
jgi:hypothetical protein